MGTAGRSLYSPQPSSASAEERAGRARVGTPISRMPYTGDRSQSIPVSQNSMPTAWAGAAGPAASLLSPSPGAPAGWGQLQLDCPLSSQLGTLELRYNCGQTHCAHTAAPSSQLRLWFSPRLLPSRFPFLGSRLLSPSCSCAFWLLASTLAASQCWLLPASSKVTSRWGHPTLGQSCHRVTSKTAAAQGHSPVTVGHQ